MANSCIKIVVKRKEPVMVTPSEATPHELKPLSDLDDQESLRHQTPILIFYRRQPSAESRRNPAEVVKAALARLLVYYYPFAGRIREGPGRKLIVETTGEGVVFVEAEADVGLDDFGELRPPFPAVEELLYNVPGTEEVVGGALLLIQVTQLTCGGFIFGVRMNHAICDGAGIGQFMIALGELARGAPSPSVLPVWDRHLIAARHPAQVKFEHAEYKDGATDPPIMGEMIERSFYFGPVEIMALRAHLPLALSASCGLYELLSAALWQARTRALGFPRPDHPVKLLCVVNARSRYTPPLPLGYYGNAFGLPAVRSTAGELSAAPLGQVVELVQAAVATVTDEYMRSETDFVVAKGRPPASVSGTYHVSDLTKHGFANVDFGWGRPAFCGVAKIGTNPGVASFLTLFERGDGEKGIIVPTCLPEKAMERFLKELRTMTRYVPNGFQYHNLSSAPVTTPNVIPGGLSW